MNSDIFEKYESEVRSYCRSFPTVFKKAKGSVLTDTEGKEYIVQDGDVMLFRFNV